MLKLQRMYVHNNDETNPIQYKEDEYDQFLNALNYNPKKM